MVRPEGPLAGRVGLVESLPLARLCALLVAMVERAEETMGFLLWAAQVLARTHLVDSRVALELLRE